MKRATITEAKNGLSALIDQVRAGETVLITDRGVPVAQLGPATAPADEDPRIERLVRAGLATRGTGDFTEFLKLRPVEMTPGPSAADYIIEERESGW